MDDMVVGNESENKNTQRILKLFTFATYAEETNRKKLANGRHSYTRASAHGNAIKRMNKPKRKLVPMEVIRSILHT